MSRWDEVTQLEEALKALKTQPYDAQCRMLEYLHARIHGDHAKAMQEREAEARERIAKKKATS
jgi:hypothetical protein